MPSIGVAVAIVQDGQVLLVRRGDFKVWSLPGGTVAAGESLAQAAVREAREEVGLAVELVRLVGAYSQPGWYGGGNHELAFVARPAGGTLRPRPGEILEARYFDPGRLPQDLLWWQRQELHDALQGAGGSLAWLQDVDWPFRPGMTLEEMIAESRAEGRTPPDFSTDYCGAPRPDCQRLEVGDRLEPHP